MVSKENHHTTAQSYFQIVSILIDASECFISSSTVLSFGKSVIQLKLSEKSEYLAVAQRQIRTNKQCTLVIVLKIV